MLSKAIHVWRANPIGMAAGREFFEIHSNDTTIELREKNSKTKFVIHIEVKTKK